MYGFATLVCCFSPNVLFPVLFDVTNIKIFMLSIRKEAKSFSILNDLEELIREPTHIPDRPNQFLNTPDLCFTTTPSSYKYTIFPPIGNSDHNLIALSYNAFSPTAPPCPKRTFWHFNRANWGAMRRFFVNYHWSESCFVSGNASVSAVILEAMGKFIPSSTKSFSP